MSSKNYIVDNSIVGMILLSLSRSKIKFKNQDKEKTEFSYFISPSDLIGEDLENIQLDTYGILNKNKLLLREPIIRDQISYVKFDRDINFKDDLNGIDIISDQIKIFYFYSIENYDHKYNLSVFTNLGLNKVNIIFPNKDTIHFYSEKKDVLKKYIKKLTKNIVDNKYFTEIKLPTRLELRENNSLINAYELTNKTFIGLSYQLVNLLNLISKNPNKNIKVSENNNHYLNNLFFSFYSLFPSFLSSFIFRFLLRFNGSMVFSKQILEINNTFTSENYIFSNFIDEDQSISSFKIGDFLPKILLKSKNKNLKDLFTDEINIVCSSNSNINTKENLITLKTEDHKGLDGQLISTSSYELLNLNDCFYVVSKDGLVQFVDLIKNFEASMKTSQIKSKYSDKKQKSMDSFDVKNFTASLPRASFNLRLPPIFKKQ
jgi:hypothetical protein